MANQGENGRLVRPVDNSRPATGATRPAAGATRPATGTSRPATGATRPAGQHSAAGQRPAGNTNARPAVTGKPAGNTNTATGKSAGNTNTATGKPAGNSRPAGAQNASRPVQSGRPLTPEELAARRAAAAKAAEAKRAAAAKAQREAAEKAAAEKKARRQKRADVVSRVVAVLIVLAVLALLVWGGVALLRKLRHTDTPDQPSGSAYTMASAVLSFDGVPYLNFTELARHFDLRIVGDSRETRFLTETDEARLKVGFRTATVGDAEVPMAGEVVYLDGAYWVPMEFVGGHVKGLLVTLIGNYPVLSRTTETDAEGVTLEVPLSFSAQRVDGGVDPVIPGTEPTGTNPPVTNPPVTEDPILAIVDHVTFGADLSAYERYMNPTGEERDAYLVLVNKTETVTADLVPSPVVKLNTDYTYNGRKVEMQETAAMAMEAMFRELFRAGYTDMHVTSGYRSYEYQVSLYNEYVSQEMAENKKLTRAEAEAIVDTYSARAGTSEHQTGLCADMHNLSSADVKFAKKEAYRWLTENAWKFGFVLRFPEDKVSITGYSFEPWHWRFVGRYHAYKIWQAGLCLEEYLGQIE